MRYTYFCERCGSTFDVDIADDEPVVPPYAVCPKCEFPRAVKFFAVSRPSPNADCAPNSGC